MVAKAAVLAQLLLRDEGASEEDCAAVIPAPTVADAPASNAISWGWLALPLVGLIAFGLIRTRAPRSSVRLRFLNFPAAVLPTMRRASAAAGTYCRSVALRCLIPGEGGGLALTLLVRGLAYLQHVHGPTLAVVVIAKLFDPGDHFQLHD